MTQMALVVMDVLRHEAGLKVPTDMAVVGYDDTPPARWPSYDSTSFSQPAMKWLRILFIF